METHSVPGDLEGGVVKLFGKCERPENGVVTTILRRGRLSKGHRLGTCQPKKQTTGNRQRSHCIGTAGGGARHRS